MLDRTTVKPGAMLEMRVEVDGPCGGYPSGSVWIPVEIMSYPSTKKCESCDKDNTEVYVRTWPKKSFSAIWVPIQILRKPDV